MKKQNQLWILVNEEEQSVLLSALDDFDISKLNLEKDNYFYPIVVDFDNKTIERSTSNLACACASSAGIIIKDFNTAKDMIEKHLNEEQPEK